MWAGGELQFSGAFAVGDEVTKTSRIEDIAFKTGATGPLAFVTVRHVYQARGAKRARRAPGHRLPRARGNAARAPALAEAVDARAAFAVEATPTLLFRYSAMTFNGHRIHYDAPYAAGEEGYSGLVVHGPMQATLMLHAAAKALGRAPARFAYRGLSPLIAGAPFRVEAYDGRDGLATRVVSAAGAKTMSGPQWPRGEAPAGRSAAHERTRTARISGSQSASLCAPVRPTSQRPSRKQGPPPSESKQGNAIRLGESFCFKRFASQRRIPRLTKASSAIFTCVQLDLAMTVRAGLRTPLFRRLARAPNSRRSASSCAPSAGEAPERRRRLAGDARARRHQFDLAVRRRDGDDAALRMGDEIVEFVERAAGDAGRHQEPHRRLAGQPPSASPTRASSAARLATRALLEAKRGSAASAASPSTSPQSRTHSRSFWIDSSTCLPSAQGNAP